MSDFGLLIYFGIPCNDDYIHYITKAISYMINCIAFMLFTCRL